MGEKQGIEPLFTSKEWAEIMEIGRGVINRHFEAAQDVLNKQYTITPTIHFASKEQSEVEQMKEVVRLEQMYRDEMANQPFFQEMDKAVERAKTKEDEDAQLFKAEAERLHSLDAAAYAAQFLEKKQQEQKEREYLELEAEYWRLRAQRNAELANQSGFASDAANVELDYLRKYKADNEQQKRNLKEAMKFVHPSETHSDDYMINGAASMLKSQEKAYNDTFHQLKAIEHNYDCEMDKLKELTDFLAKHFPNEGTAGAGVHSISVAIHIMHKLRIQAAHGADVGKAQADYIDYLNKGAHIDEQE